MLALKNNPFYGAFFGGIIGAILGARLEESSVFSVVFLTLTSAIFGNNVKKFSISLMFKTPVICGCAADNDSDCCAATIGFLR